jgi:hypothetical protein
VNDQASASTTLADCVEKFDWGRNPEALRRGDLSSIDGITALRIREAAKLGSLLALAAALGKDAITVVIGLLARAAAGKGDRNAGRVARSILANADAKLEEDAAKELGIG